MRSPCGRCIMSRVPNAGPAALIERLNNLYEGPLVLPGVIRLGDAAVPGLEAILRGPSQALPHARCMAADALGAIGGPEAASALVGALRDSIARTPDVISLEAERVVVDRIANHLCAHRENDVIEALLEALRITPYPACARALGELKDPRAIPLLIECLHDDAARGAALDALRRFGWDACPALIGTLIQPRLRRGLEAPSSIGEGPIRLRAVRLIRRSPLSCWAIRTLRCESLRAPRFSRTRRRQSSPLSGRFSHWAAGPGWPAFASRSGSARPFPAAVGSKACDPEHDCGGARGSV